MSNLSLINPFETKQSVTNLFPIFVGCATVFFGVTSTLGVLNSNQVPSLERVESFFGLCLGLYFILLGLSLVLSVFKFRVSALAISGLVVISCITTTLFMGGHWMAVFRKLLSDTETVSLSHTLFLPVSSVICLFICGLVIAILNTQLQWNKVLTLIALVMAMSMMAILSRLLLGSPKPAGRGFFVMDQLPAVLFFFLGIGIIVWGLSLSPRNTGHWINVLVFSTTSVLILFVVFEWKSLRTWEYVKTQREIDQRLMGIFSGKVNAFYDLHQNLETENKRIQIWENLNETTWQASGKLFLDDHPYFKALLFVSPDFEIIWNLPKTKTLFVEAFHEVAWPTLCHNQVSLLDVNKNRTSHSVLLPDGKRAVFLLAPLAKNGEISGYSIGVFCIEEFLFVPEISNESNSFNFHIYNDEQLSIKPGVLRHSAGMAAQITLPLGDESWTMELIPTVQFLALRRSVVPNVLLVAGLVLAMSLVYLNYIRSSFKSRALALHGEIGKRIASEQSLRESQRQLQLILDSSMDGILGLEPNGKISFANQEACDLTGFSVEELTSFDWQKLCRSKAGCENYLRELRDQKIILLHKDRIDFLAVVSLQWLTNELGSHTFGVVTFQDQTALQEQEQAILHYTHELERSNAALKEFAYVASHDLKAPLRGILQLASWIREESVASLTPQSVAYFELLENRANRLNHLLDDLLRYSKAGHKHGDFQEVDLAFLISNIFELHSQKAHLKLEMKLDVERISTLKVPLEQVLRNLISNAAKHHDKPSGVIRVSCFERKHSYVFVVFDDGPGIPAEHYERIFRIFQTLRARDETESSGMGLAIVKKILETYQCAIEVESDGKSWTQFTFQWPFEANIRSLVNET